MTPIIKICGLTEPEHIKAAIRAKASHIGLVLHPRSPRKVTMAQASKLARTCRVALGSTKLVALVSEPTPDVIRDICAEISPDVIQFHGAETGDMLTEIRKQMPDSTQIWKAIAIGEAEDVSGADQFAHIADRLLFDARPPEGALYEGGHGVAFDWSVLAGYNGALPWVLAGGLTPANVCDAVNAVGAIRGFSGVDVSSGVETAPGQKETNLITGFIRSARRAMDKV